MLETELRCWASFLFAILLEILKASIYLDFEIEQFYTTIIFYILCMYSWNIYGGTKKVLCWWYVPNKEENYIFIQFNTEL